MITYFVSKISTEMDAQITSISVYLPISNNTFIEIEFFTVGAGIRKISYIDKGNHMDKLLTLSYKDILESCHNQSLSGLTIGPNAGRLEANKDIIISDRIQNLKVNLPANEDSTKQIHGGEHNLSRAIWNYNGIEECCDASIKISFTYSQEANVDGWPGNRFYKVTYLICEDGSLNIFFDAKSDCITYINMTNHTYWLRQGTNFSLLTDSYIENKADFLPDKIIPINTGNKTLSANEVLNNAFIINPANKTAAKITYNQIPLRIELSSNTPAIVVYTGDYLDNETELINGLSSMPGQAIALEPQELYPFTETTLTTPIKPFHRWIKYKFLLTQ